MTIPPIATWYAGILFRSRTEARWAVFFDELDIKWEYEPQGFEADGERYLPDFLAFPALGMLWPEVKGGWDTDPEGVARWRKFAAFRPQPSRACLLAGSPAPRAPVLVIGGSEDGPPHDGPWEDAQEWRPCPAGYHFDLAFAGTFRSKYAEDGCTPCPGDGEQRLERAIAAARSARFGHGEPARGERE